MKKLTLALTFLIVAAALLLAQSFAPPQLTLGPPIATSVTQCVAPAAHTASFCPVEAPAGVITVYVYNGTSYVTLQGAPGPQGPPGPVQSFLSFSCTTSNISNVGLNASGCSEK